MKGVSLLLNQGKDMKEKRTIKQQIPEPNMTQREIARILDAPRHEISKIESDALKKLKRRLEEKGYDKESFF